MTWLDPLIRKTVLDVARPIIVEAVDEAIRTSPLIQFIKAGQLRLLEKLVDVDHRQAWDLFRDALKAHLHDEKISFGDPRYSWTADDARDLADELIIQHAETAA